MTDKSVKVDLDAARAAVHTFETSLKGLNLPPETIADLKADIATMKAQLEKADPSHSIVAEAGHSLRKAAEDIGAEVLEPGRPIRGDGTRKSHRGVLNIPFWVILRVEAALLSVSLPTELHLPGARTCASSPSKSTSSCRPTTCRSAPAPAAIARSAPASRSGPSCAISASGGLRPWMRAASTCRCFRSISRAVRRSTAQPRWPWRGTQTTFCSRRSRRIRTASRVSRPSPPPTRPRARSSSSARSRGSAARAR